MKRSQLAGMIALVSLLAACSSTAEETTRPETVGGTETSSTTAAVAPTVSAPLVIQADVVSGPRNIPPELRATAVCVGQTRYARNSEVVWRVRVLDTVTGEALGEGEVESVVVMLGDGQPFEMRFGDHPRDNPTDRFWTAAWDVPADYPTGSISYTIVATGLDGATATFTPFEVAPSLLTITDEVLATIEEEGA